MRLFSILICSLVLFLNLCLAETNYPTTTDNCMLPVAQCKSGIIEIPATGGNGMAVVTPQDIDDGSFDDAGGPVTLEFADGETELTFPCPSDNASLVHFVELVAIDQSDNESSCFAFVLVTDPTPPVAICKDITVELDGSGTAAVSNTDINDGSFDNCSSNLFSTQLIIPFSCNDIGPNTVTLTARDGGNNVSNCTGIVTIEDNVAPTANCEPTTVQLNAQGMAAITGDDITSQLSDACGIQSEALSQSSFDCNDIGAHTVTLTVTDVNGNSTSCSASVTVEDIPPVPACQSTTLTLDSGGNGSITVNDVEGNSTDACGIQSSSINQETFDCADIGPNTVILTVTDVNGNSSTCTATITVQDMTAPLVSCMSVTVLLDDMGEGFLSPEEVLNSSSDDCGGTPALRVSPSQFECPNLGENTVTLFATDDSGNTGTCTATVTVEEDLSVVTLPCIWTADPNGINCPGGVSFDFGVTDDSFILTTEGCYDPNFYSNSDSQGFIQQELCGDGEIIAYVNMIDGDAWAGIALRESNAPEAKVLQLAVNNGGLAQRKLRTSTGGMAFQHLFQNQGRFWLRLTRSGNLFGAYLSLDGSNWHVVLLTNILMSNCLKAGMILSNATPGSAATATFDHVEVKPPVGGNALQAANSQLPITNDQHPISQSPNYLVPVVRSEERVPNTQLPIAQSPSQTVVQVYPNPTRGALNLVLESFPDKPVELQVFNQQGQRVLIKFYDKNHAPVEKLWLEHLQNGLYFLRIKVEEQFFTKKVNVIH